MPRRAATESVCVRRHGPVSARAGLTRDAPSAGARAESRVTSAMLARAGMSPSYATLVADLYDTHNAGGVDVEEGVGEVRRGETELREVFASLLRQAQ